MDLSNFMCYQTPKNSPDKQSSDSSKYFTPDSHESSRYSSPNPKFSNTIENETLFYTPKNKNVRIGPETTRFYTPQNQNNTFSGSLKYSTPMNRSSKSLRFGDTVQFDSPKSRLLQNTSAETF